MQNNYNLNNGTGHENSYEDRLHDYAAAKISERSFEQYVKNHSKKGFKLKDVSNIKEYQHKDIDFIGVAADGTETTYEIKNDTTCFDGRCTGNICLELTQRGKDSLGREYFLDGWFERTEADKLFILSNIKGNDDYYRCTEFDVTALRELHTFRDDLFKERYSATGCKCALINYYDLLDNLNPADYKVHGNIKIIKD